MCFDFFFIMLIFACVLHAYCIWCVLDVCMLFMVDIPVALIDRMHDRDCLCDECVLLLSLCVSVYLL